MKSVLYLNNYFKNYTPKDFYIFNVIFYILQKTIITSEENIKENLNFIKNNLNKNDINLIANYIIDYENLNFIKKTKFIFSKLFFLNIWKKLIIEEIASMMQFDLKENNKILDLLKYYLPIKKKFDLQPYSQMIPNIYYLTRNQLLLCKDIEEIIIKLKYDEQFKEFIIKKIYEENKDISNKMVFSFRVMSVFEEIQQYLELTSKEQEELYIKNLDDNKEILNTFFGKSIKI